MLVHSVYFWLKPECAQEEFDAFRAGLESLAGIECVQALYVGTPAATPERPVIDSSYTYALTVLLESAASHDTYQSHPLHMRFLERFAQDWEKVLIYDAE